MSAGVHGDPLPASFFAVDQGRLAAELPSEWMAWTPCAPLFRFWFRQGQLSETTNRRIRVRWTAAAGAASSVDALHG
jgi:hypothetical protein